jgi:hypothetical protein
MWLKNLFSKPSPETGESSSIPAITAAVIAEAKRQPGGWVYAMDGIADPNGDVPAERIRGAWKVSASGEIEGGFIPNPNYRPISSGTLPAPGADRLER